MIMLRSKFLLNRFFFKSKASGSLNIFINYMNYVELRDIENEPNWRSAKTTDLYQPLENMQ